MSKGLHILRYSLVRDRTDTRPALTVGTWSELAARLAVHTRTAQKDGPAFIPAVFRDGAPRVDANVIEVTAAAYDLDSVTPDQVVACGERIEADGVAYAAYSTYSHDHASGEWCVRIVLPLSRPVTPLEWPRVWQGIATRYQIPADVKAKNASRLYYLPSAPVGSDVFAAQAPGAPVDVDSLLSRASPVAPPTVGAPTDAGPVDLVAIRDYMASTRGELGALFKHVLRGEPLSGEGGRDTAVHAVTGALAFRFPEVPDAALLTLIEPSVRTMPGPEGGEHWIAEARAKLARARERYVQREAESAEERGSLLAIIRGTDPDTGDALTTCYGTADVERLALEHGSSVEELLSTRVVIQYGARYFFLTDRGYLDGIGREAAENAFRRDLLPWSEQIAFTTPTANGGERQVKLAEVVQRHGSVARNLVYSVADVRSRYSPGDRTLRLATAPLRALNAMFDAEIDHWLSLFGADQVEALKDWIACATVLDRPSCAIYLEGAPKVGKSLFAEGLARLWSSSGATRLTAEKMASWNDSFLRCPLLFVDETLGAAGRSSADASSLIRDLITSTDHDLRRKFMDGARIEGAFRLVFGANNPRLLRFSEQMTEDDIAALESRFLLIRPPVAAAEYLARIGGRGKTESWVQGDGLARHALWLHETRRVTPGERLLVEGRPGSLTDRLAAGAGIAPSVCEWVVKFLIDERRPPDLTQFVMIGNGEVWVCPTVIAHEDRWGHYVGSERVPGLKTAAQALQGMSTPGQPRRRTAHGHISYRRVRGRIILDQARAFGLWDEALETAINAPNKEMSDILERL